MASTQCEKIQNATYHQEPTRSEAHHNNNHTTNTNEHTLSDKVKDMAHSARKLFHHHEPPHHTQKPAGNCSCGVKKTEAKNKNKKKIAKNPDGHESHCMPKMLDRVKNLKNKGLKHSGSSSDSDSDNEITKNKK